MALIELNDVAPRPMTCVEVKVLCPANGHAKH